MGSESHASTSFRPVSVMLYRLRSGPAPGSASPTIAFPSRQAGERGVHLAEGQRPAPPEVGVVIALQVVAVARFAIEEAEQGHGNTHT